MEHSKSLRISQLETLDKFTEVVALQQEIWGFHDVELLPRRLFVVASRIGGQVLGGYDGERLVAFCLCLPGRKPDGKNYFYSHMLGVHSDYRNTGLGRRLKLHQRDFALANGVNLIEWTFDPLEIKNAFFNIEKLGVIVRRFVHNQYGTTTSHLHGGLPTDRLVAEWWLDSPRVRVASAQESLPPAATGGAFYRIPVPSDIGEVRAKDPEKARGVQSSIAAQFDEYFGKGMAVVGFEKTTAVGIYLLSKWESD